MYENQASIMHLFIPRYSQGTSLYKVGMSQPNLFLTDAEKHEQFKHFIWDFNPFFFLQLFFVGVVMSPRPIVKLESNIGICSLTTELTTG